MTTYLYGAYGTGNLGDDALLKSALECYGNKDTYAICYRKPFLETPPQWIEHFEFIENPKKYLRKGDRLIFAGGGLFWTSSHADVMANLALAASNMGCHVCVDRIGTQGVNCNIEAARALFDLCEEISVRDRASVKILKDLQLTDRAVAKNDLVLYLKDIPARISNSSDRVKIGINHSVHLFFFDAEHRKKTLYLYSEIANSLPDVEFYYIPHTRHFNVMSENDIITGEYFWKVSKGRIESLRYPATVEEWLKQYNQMSAVMGWRYHMLVVGTLLGKPAAHLGQLGGHKYGAFASEHELPQINYDAPLDAIIASAIRYVNLVKDGTAKIAKPCMTTREG